MEHPLVCILPKIFLHQLYNTKLFFFYLQDFYRSCVQLFQITHFCQNENVEFTSPKADRFFLKQFCVNILYSLLHFQSLFPPQLHKDHNSNLQLLHILSDHTFQQLDFKDLQYNTKLFLLKDLDSCKNYENHEFKNQHSDYYQQWLSYYSMANISCQK